MRRTLATGLLLLCMAAGATDAPPATPLVGIWNGERVSLELTATGGSVEFDCAHGDLEQPVVPDAKGRFDVPGHYVEEHGGPVHADEPVSGIAVRYTGRVTDGRMTLTVVLADTNTSEGTYSLDRGGESVLMKCR